MESTTTLAQQQEALQWAIETARCELAAYNSMKDYYQHEAGNRNMAIDYGLKVKDMVNKHDALCELHQQIEEVQNEC